MKVTKFNTKVMSGALVNGVRRALSQRVRSAPARTFKTSAPKRGGGGGDEPVSAPSRGFPLAPPPPPKK